MFREAYTPIKRGFDEHMGYYQGCGSAYTHIAACCSAGSADNDTHFTCAHTGAGKDYRGYDWFRSGPAPNAGKSVPDLSASTSNSATLISDAAIDFIHRQHANTPFFLYLPFQNIHAPYTCDARFRNLYAHATHLTEEEKTIFGYISELDDAVGSVVGALHEAERYDNSIVVSRATMERRRIRA